MKIFFTLCWICFLLSCRSQSSKQTESNPTKNILELVGKDAEQFLNPSGKYKLYVQKKDENFPSRLVTAAVADTKTNLIIWKDRFVPGYIKWIGETNFEILDMPEVIKSDQSLLDYIRIVDINSIKKL